MNIFVLELGGAWRSVPTLMANNASVKEIVQNQSDIAMQLAWL